MTDDLFLAIVRAAGQSIGYGRMLSIVSHQWYSEDPNGALAIGPCYCHLPARQQRDARARAEADPLFREGIDHE